MLITNEQMRKLEGTGAQNFLGYMIGHLREHFPASSQLMGEDGLRALVDEGIKNAARYGFSTRYEVCLYTDIMLTLGAGFDTDIQLHWVRNILKPVMPVDPRKKIDDLVDAVYNYLDEVAGEDQVFPVIQYEQLQEQTMQEFGAATDQLQENRVLETFRNFWAAKYLYVGEPTLKQLILQGSKVARSFGFTNRVSVEYFLLLMFLFGHQFYNDPAFPKLSVLLQRKDIPAEKEKYQQVFQCVQSMIAGFIDNA
jgi:hypothetical protein